MTNSTSFSAHRSRMRAGVNYLRTATLPSGKRVTVRLYEIWMAMRKRCYKPSNDNYYHYGARGIRICDAWRDDYDAFRAWAISHGYRKDLTIDRIDPAGNYEPSNCRWATRAEQTYNCTSVYRLTLNGVTKLLPEWARERDMSMEILRVRKREGWTDEEILTTPKGGHRPGFIPKKRGPKPKSSLLLGCSAGTGSK